MAATAIALVSLGLAALTVLVSYLNVRRQAQAAAELEHTKWLRQKQDELYTRLIKVLVAGKWTPPPRSDDPRWAELDEVMRTSLRYASDAVLANAQALADEIRQSKGLGDAEGDERQGLLLQTREHMFATTSLVRNIRAELVGEREAEKTWRRYETRRATPRRRFRGR